MNGTGKAECRMGLVLSTIIVLVLLMAGCPLTIDDQIARQLSDASAPTVSITSPLDNTVYSQRVAVTGTTTDPGGEVRELHYVVTGTLGVLTRGTLTDSQIGAGGVFGFSFSSIGFSGPVQLQVEAVDWNDNSGSTAISLQYSGSQLSSFAVEAGNKSASVVWEALPNADSYTIYYTGDGTLPSEQYGTTIEVTQAGYEITGLENGALHTFLLSANAGGEALFWSNYVRAIPLSPFTLAPRVQGEYRRIELEWQPIAGETGYEVYRSTSADGPYRNYTGTISRTTFTDTSITEGVWYYYKVKPALEGAELSVYNAARSAGIPETSARVRSLPTPSPTNKVAVAGDYAYVAAGTGGLLIVNIAAPAEPRLIGSLQTTDAQDVAADGTHVYVADGPGGILAVDASVPSAPALVDTYAEGIGNASRLGVDATNDRLFVIDDSGDTSLVTIDVANPVALALLDTVTEATHRFRELAVVATESGGISSSTVYAVGKTDYPGDVMVFHYTLAEGSPVVILHDSRLFDPGLGHDLPLQVAAHGTSVFLLTEPPWVVSGSRPYSLSTYSGLQDTSPGVVTGLDGYPADLAWADGLLVAVDEYNLQVFDATDIENPVRLYQVDTPAKPTGVALKDANYAYVAAGTPYFQTVDLQQPSSLSVVGSYTESSVVDARVRGNRAYVAAWSPNRLQVLDVSTPSLPAAMGSAELVSANKVVLSGPYAFVASGGAGLSIVDISEPFAPFVVGSIESIAGSLYSIDIKGDYVYAAGSGGLEIYDIADPASPKWAGLIDSGTGGMRDLIVRGDRVYVVEGAYFEPSSFKIVDIASPTEARLVAEKPGLAIMPARVAVGDGYALVTDSYFAGADGGGVTTINVDPANPAFLSSYGAFDPVDGETVNDHHSAFGITVSGDFAFVGTNEAGVVVLDISDPTSPLRIADTGALGFSPTTIRLSGSQLYVAAGGSGLQIISLH